MKHSQKVLTVIINWWMPFVLVLCAVCMPAYSKGYYFFHITGIYQSHPDDRCSSEYPSPKVAVEHCINEEDPFDNGSEACTAAYTGYKYQDEEYDKAHGLMRGWALFDMTCPNGVSKRSVWMPRSGKVCSFPYSYDAKMDDCITYCPPYKPQLDSETGLCYAPGGQSQCTVGNPIELVSGRKVKAVAIEHAIDAQSGLNFRHYYSALSTPESDPAYGYTIRYGNGSLSAPGWRKYIQPTGYGGIAKSLLTRDELVFDENLKVQLPPSGYKSWRHSFQLSLLVHKDENSFILFRPDGSTIRAKRDGGYFISDQYSSLSLARLADMSWEVTLAPDRKEVYSERGYPKEIQWGAQSVKYVYDKTNRINALIFSDGREIRFEYFSSSKRLKRTLFPGGSYSEYSYDLFGNMVSLTHYGADGVGAVLSREFAYEDTKNPYSLTASINEKGDILAQWQYDSYGRAVRSSRGSDKEVTVIDYSGLQETDDPHIGVTNYAGKKTIYYLNTSTDHKKIVRVEGRPSANCAASNKFYDYFENGTFRSKTDWSGNVTTFVRDELGREVSRTEAAGTVDARTITTEYHPTLNKPVKIIEPGKVTTMTYDAEGRLTSNTTQPAVGPEARRKR